MLLIISLNFNSVYQGLIILAVIPAGIFGSILGHGIEGYRDPVRIAGVLLDGMHEPGGKDEHAALLGLEGVLGRGLRLVAPVVRDQGVGLLAGILEGDLGYLLAKIEFGRECRNSSQGFPTDTSATELTS